MLCIWHVARPVSSTFSTRHLILCPRHCPLVTISSLPVLLPGPFDMADVHQPPLQQNGTGVDEKQPISPVPSVGGDVEKQNAWPDGSQEQEQDQQQQQQHDSLSSFKSLAFLDRFLAIWIFLAMLIGILLGNFVDDVGPALQRGTFVDVSLPIGTLLPSTLARGCSLTLLRL